MSMYIIQREREEQAILWEEVEVIQGASRIKTTHTENLHCVLSRNSCVFVTLILMDERLEIRMI
jgi:hypothetical protein